LWLEDLFDLARVAPPWVDDPSSLDDWLWAVQCAGRKLVGACFAEWASEHNYTRSEALDVFLPPRPFWRDEGAARETLARTMAEQAGEWEPGFSWRRSAQVAAMAGTSKHRR
jgi:hypothetical protein